MGGLGEERGMLGKHVLEKDLHRMPEDDRVRDLAAPAEGLRASRPPRACVRELRLRTFIIVALRWRESRIPSAWQSVNAYHGRRRVRVTSGVGAQGGRLVAFS